MMDGDREKAEEFKRSVEKWSALAAEMNRAGAAADGDAVIRASTELVGEAANLVRELGSNLEHITGEHVQDVEASVQRVQHEFAAFELARAGEVVATATFDPGIAPFTIEVRRVPVPVTNSKHFIVSLYRGQYVVTSFRYFWPGYTPERVHVSWPCINRFTVTFDDTYEASCDWRWGAGATWSMTVPDGSREPGLSPYFFTPRNPLPPGCPDFPLD
jgi:hypothetical protein